MHSSQISLTAVFGAKNVSRAQNKPVNIELRTVAKKQKPKLSAKKPPAKKAVTPSRRSTAGIGFDFEDCVAAWFLLQALAGRGLLVEGCAQRLQMQTGSLRWDVDDLLVTTQGETVARRLAISCKGNVQVSATGLPESFATQAWRLWTKAA